MHCNLKKQLIKYLRVFPWKRMSVNLSLGCLRSVAGLVFQATGRMEFEDGLRPGSPGEVLHE